MTFDGFRSFTWRLGRFAYRWARRENGNQPRTNGEYWLLDLVVRESQRQPVVLMDVGANRGDWSAAAVAALKRHGKRGDIHAFEPVAATFDHLSRRFEDDSSITPHNVALSDRSEEAQIHVVGALAGRNSLHPLRGASVERVALRTLDAFLSDLGISHIAMVKSDTEGHDLTVLQGGRESLQAGCVDVWQFEYNHRWLTNRASLLAAFDYIEELPYRLGKLHSNGIELYDEWHFELDRFFESNYVLVRRGTVYEGIAKVVRFGPANVPR